MSLTLVAVPIGNPQDITLRAIKALKNAEVIIGEETKPLFQLFKSLELPRPENTEFLNEHSKDVDLEFFLGLCKEKNVVLVTDCGTPGFCDPGADLVRLCRKNKIEVKSLPGASSLMVLLSQSGQQLKEFYFRGFLPAKTEERQRELQSLKNTKVPIVLMDTPYRFRTLLEDLKKNLPNFRILIGIDMTSENEAYVESKLTELSIAKLPEKAEFVLILYPN